MAIDHRTRQILWGRAGATCSYPGCRRNLVRDATPEDREVVVGEIAHIIAQSKGGPRADFTVSSSSIDGYNNLILLCHEHHELVDQQPHTYPVEKLQQFKIDHEEWVRSRLSKEQEYEDLNRPNLIVEETVYSNILPISHIPRYIYYGKCINSENEVKKRIIWPKDDNILTPFIIRSGQLYAFNDLSEYQSPFSTVVDPVSTQHHGPTDWQDDPDLLRWYVELLNRTVNKITGRLGLKLDKEHHRYFFEPDEQGKDKRVAYQSIGGVRSERNVAWNPHFKHNDLPKNYWEHLAVSLQFHRLDTKSKSWGLSIRPERRFTTNGFDLLESKSTGKKNNTRKSRMYNFDVLQEVQFWRDFLSKGQTRITCNFGREGLVIENSLMNAKINWPEISDDKANRMAASYEDDLFTLADLRDITEFDEFDENLEDVEIEEELQDED